MKMLFLGAPGAGKGTQAVIDAGCTIYVSEFVRAVEKAVANATASDATEKDTVKLGVATTQTTKDATEDAAGQNKIESTVFAAAVNADVGTHPVGPVAQQHVDGHRQRPGQLAQVVHIGHPLAALPHGYALRRNHEPLRQLILRNASFSAVLAQQGGESLHIRHIPRSFP